MIRFDDSRDWFFEKRFGMFIHWGIYSVGGVHEQELWRMKMEPATYYRYMKEFNPVDFDPVRWLDIIQETGMEYLVFTAKHHDGFCLWDTRFTDCNVMNTPYRRDILGMLAEECHKRSFPLVIYYSAVDWHHPAYPNLGRSHEIYTDVAHHDLDQYIDFVKNQLRELCTNYGQIHGLWWDMNVTGRKDPSVNALIRQLQPSAVINNRGYDTGDFSTPEREDNDRPIPYANPTEACESVGSISWGFRTNEEYYTPNFLKNKIAKNLACGTNFILNAGPDARGNFSPEALAILKDLGSWYRRLRPALTASPCLGVIANDHIFCTGGGNKLYLILPDSPATPVLNLAPLDVRPERVRLLNDGRQLPFTTDPVFKIDNPALRISGIPTDATEIQAIEIDFADPVITGKEITTLKNMIFYDAENAE